MVRYSVENPTVCTQATDCIEYKVRLKYRAIHFK